MRDPERFLLDDDYDEPEDFAYAIDLARADLDDERDETVGFRSLYENPDALLPRTAS